MTTSTRRPRAAADSRRSPGGVADVDRPRPRPAPARGRLAAVPRNKAGDGRAGHPHPPGARAVFAPLIAPYGITERASASSARAPSADHWFGTDAIGRDVFSRVVYGARVSLRIGIIATAISLVIGVILGAIAGFFGGVTDTVITRINDVFLAIPYIVLAVAIATVFGRSENTVILVLGLTGWLAIARIVRSSFLSLKNLEYVEAATRARLLAARGSCSGTSCRTPCSRSSSTARSPSAA